MHRKEPGLITHPDRLAAGYDHFFSGVDSIADCEHAVLQIDIQFAKRIIKSH
jgi:hypothetical protein